NARDAPSRSTATGGRAIKEAKMNGKGIVGRWIALGLLVAAVAAPVAQAGTAPRYEGYKSSYPQLHQLGALRPDDRAGIRGVGADVVSQSSAALRPDDRAGIRGVGADLTSQPSTALRPDDRPGPLGVGEPTYVPVSGGTAFHWGDWAIGLVAGIGI